MDTGNHRRIDLGAPAPFERHRRGLLTAEALKVSISSKLLDIGEATVR